jgi:hypothetical protein
MAIANGYRFGLVLEKSVYGLFITRPGCLSPLDHSVTNRGRWRRIIAQEQTVTEREPSD